MGEGLREGVMSRSVGGGEGGGWKLEYGNWEMD